MEAVIRRARPEATDRDRHGPARCPLIMARSRAWIVGASGMRLANIRNHAPCDRTGSTPAPPTGLSHGRAGYLAAGTVKTLIWFEPKQSRTSHTNHSRKMLAMPFQGSSGIGTRSNGGPSVPEERDRDETAKLSAKLSLFAQTCRSGRPGQMRLCHRQSHRLALSWSTGWARYEQYYAAIGDSIV